MPATSTVSATPPICSDERLTQILRRREFHSADLVFLEAWSLDSRNVYDADLDEVEDEVARRVRSRRTDSAGLFVGQRYGGGRVSLPPVGSVTVP